MVTIDEQLDGRRLRRDRNREGVVQALLELYREGNLAPSSDEIAVRANISPRSLFRYFEDVDALVRTAVARQQEHLAPLYATTASVEQPLGERIDQFVADRVRLLEAMGSVGQLARSLAVRQPLIVTELARIRATLRDQVTDLFADALAGLDADDRAAVQTALDIATSWEAHHLARADHGLGKAAATKVMSTTLRRLLAPGSAR